MQDYKEIMKIALAKYYEPKNFMSEIMPVYEATTKQMWNWFRGVIPEHPIDEHDVFDILTELGFQQKQKILMERVCIVQEDKNNGIRAEYDEVEVGRILIWHLYEVI